MGMENGQFDVVIVGGRVAGCATAIRLIRAGLEVVIVERGVLPSDTLSTHLMQDIQLFEEIGVLREVLACGAPPMRATSIDLAGHDLSADVSHLPWLCMRRLTLDAVLIDAARRAGATVLMETAVTGLLHEGDRVSGVTVQRPDGTRTELRSKLVVGADGRNSTVARLAGSRKYDVMASERDAYWRYYRGLAVPEVFYFARRGPDIILTAACEQGLTLIVSQPPRDDGIDWRDRRQLEEVAGRLVPPLRSAFATAEPVGGVHTVRRMEGYFRQAAGPGWVLVGDSGHFKDVVVGQGICDALRQSRSMTSHVPAAISDPATLDAAMQTWWAERDRDAKPMYWLSQDLCRVEPTVVDRELWATLASTARNRRLMHDVFAHRLPASRIAGRSVQLQAAARATLRTSVSFPDLFAGIGAGIARDRDRMSADRRPLCRT